MLRWLTPLMTVFALGAVAADAGVWCATDLSEYAVGERLSDKGATNGNWFVSAEVVATNGVFAETSAIDYDGIVGPDTEATVVPLVFTATEAAGEDFKVFDIRLRVPERAVFCEDLIDPEAVFAFGFDEDVEGEMHLVGIVGGTAMMLSAEGVVLSDWCDIRVRMREINGNRYIGFFALVAGAETAFESVSGAVWFPIEREAVAALRSVGIAGLGGFGGFSALRTGPDPEPTLAVWCGGEEGDWDDKSNWVDGHKPQPGEMAMVAGTVRLSKDGQCAVVTEMLVAVEADGLVLLSGSVAPQPSLSASAPAVGKELKVKMGNFAGLVFDGAVSWMRSGGTQTNAWQEVAKGVGYTPTAADYGHWLKCVVTDTEGRVVLEQAFYFSKLPVCYLTTDDGLTPTAEKEEHVGHVYVQGNGEWASPYDGAMTIKVRGNSTKQYDKKPWKLKLDEKTKMFGIPKSKHWVLLANALDNSSLRNKLAYDSANEIGSQGMQSTWVECFLNGKYCGLYQFCEHIRVDKNRVDIFDWEGAGEDAADAVAAANGFAKEDKKALEVQMTEDFEWVSSGKVTYTNVEYDVASAWEDFATLEIDGGCLVEMSTEFDEVTKFRISSGKLSQMPVMVNSPEFLGTNTNMLKACESRIQDFFDACTSVDGYNAKGAHWSELADIDSMVAYFLVVEMFGNDDAAEKSRYLHWDAGAPIVFGPVWDFDWGVGNTMLAYAPEGWKVQSVAGSFYREWADDPWFCTRLQRVYWSTAREPFAHLLAEAGELDRYEAYLDEAAASNSTIYNADFHKAVQRLREYLTARLAWLDEQFKDVPTLMASLKNGNSTHPYTADMAGLAIVFENAPAGVITEGWKLRLSVAVADSSVAKVDVYVNGLKVGESLAVVNGRAEAGISLKVLTEPMGVDNCVMLVARDAQGAVRSRNFALVKNATRLPTIFFVQ